MSSGTSWCYRRPLRRQRQRVDDVRLCTEGETQKRSLGIGDQLVINTIYPSGPPPPVNNAPEVAIPSPADGATYGSGASVSFTGSATDTEDSDLTASIVWTSDLDGALGTGGNGSADLSDGVHTITASVTDPGGKSGSDSVSITVGDPPAVATTVGMTGITYATDGGRNRDKNLLITVTLADNLGGLPDGASISIDLYRNGSLDARGTGTTGSDGSVTFNRSRARRGDYTTVVTDVTAAGLTWDGVTPPNSFTK